MSIKIFKEVKNYVTTLRNIQIRRFNRQCDENSVRWENIGASKIYAEISDGYQTIVGFKERETREE